MNLELLIILIIMIVFIIIFLYIEPLLMKHKVKNRNEYGSARFSTLNEIKKNFKSENIYNIKEAGFPVSFSTDLKTIYKANTADEGYENLLELREKWIKRNVNLDNWINN